MTKAAELAKMGEVLTNSQIGGRRNIIINGAMQVFQRGSATFNHNATATANLYGLDRYQFQSSNQDELEGTITQVADAPVGFTNSLKWTTTEPESAIAADETFDCCQKIEAQDLQQLAFGTSSAKKLTLSFYVKSSVTGTYGINVYKADSTARQLTSTYTISSANTWEEKTIIIPADTDSGGTIANDNGEGLRITWHLGTGSNFTSANNALTWSNYADGGWAFGHAQNGVATTDNATWQLTGVQLEVGEQATPFEHRSFGEELALCQRYFERTEGIDSSARSVGGFAVGAGVWYATNQLLAIFPFKQTKRAIPSISVSASDAIKAYTGSSSAIAANDSSVCDAIGLHSARFNFTPASVGTAGHGTLIQIQENKSISVDAEL